MVRDAGLGRDDPSSFRLLVKLLSRTMFMGDPCPMKSTGILSRSVGFPEAVIVYLKIAGNLF
jgi:hypothetical protein